MRNILIDNARRKLTGKRGAGSAPPRHGGSHWRPSPRPNLDEELLALDEALKKLAEQDPQKAKLVELRYFAGTDRGAGRRGVGYLADHGGLPLGLRGA